MTITLISTESKTKNNYFYREIFECNKTHIQ